MAEEEEEVTLYLRFRLEEVVVLEDLTRDQPLFRLDLLIQLQLAKGRLDQARQQGGEIHLLEILLL
ncbi:MAG: hypothetical protein EBR82_67190 [Caulobacteraceae bacterium]|nr:hypothetical protein [Caulobacteraceae bacterium]